ncbi:MAG: helix-turn-helix domain-containing protein [Desulfobacteraceae bacterium]
MVKPLESNNGINLVFYRGIKQIARFLDCHPVTAKRLIKDKKIPARKDPSGRWVLCSVDYYRLLWNDND